MRGEPTSRGEREVPRIDSITTVGSDSLDRDAAELHKALSDLLRVYRFRDRKRICCEDISVTQCYTLGVVVRLGSPTLQELAREMYLDKSTMSRVVDSLVRKGHARRIPEPGDGRAVRIQATEEGVEMVGRIEQRLVEQEKELIASIDPEVRQATARLIARLARAAMERFSRRERDPAERAPER